MATTTKTNATATRQLKKALSDARTGRNMSGPHNAGKELDDYLMSLSQQSATPVFTGYSHAVRQCPY